MKNVFITGGSRGIGAAAVRAFAALGMNVAFTYKSSPDAARALSLETGALAICADAADPTAVKEAVLSAEGLFGATDVLINNAGISRSGLVTDMTDGELSELFSVNALGPIYTVRAVLPSMVRKKSGVIINVSSMWGVVGASCEVAYSAAKASVIGMTRALAKEVGPSGIRVNCIAPGVIDTDMNSGYSKEDMAALSADTPLGRIGTPKEIAELMVFLASDKASFITGQTITADGGFAL